MKCPHCDKPRKLNAKKKLLKTCGDKECVSKNISLRMQGKGKNTNWNRFY